MTEYDLRHGLEDLVNAIKQLSCCKHEWSEMKEKKMTGRVNPLIYQECKTCGFINVIMT